MLPHTNLGVLSTEDLARLREVTASQGLMLESIYERLMETVHAGLADQAPGEAAGDDRSRRASCKIPFTTGILVGIGETEDERVAVAGSDRRGARAVRAHPGGHPAELRPASALLRGGGGRDRRCRLARALGGERAGTLHSDSVRACVRASSLPSPDWANPVSVDEMKRLIAECKRLMPDVGVQVPPNLADWWPELVEAGATDLGGLSANGDHISPEEPFPSPHQVRKELAPRGYALTERLCVYPQYMDPEWMEQGVLDVIKLKYWSFIPRRGSGAAQEEPLDAGARAAGDREGAATGEELTEDELTALFAETRPEVIEEMRIAADELRAELAGDTVTFVVNRNINFTNICVVGCAFCGFGQGKRSPDAYEVGEEDFAARIEEAVDFGATEICMQGGIHPD